MTFCLHFDQLFVYFLSLGGKGFNNKVEFVNHQAQPTCNFLTTSDVTYKCDKCEDSFNNVKGICLHF